MATNNSLESVSNQEAIVKLACAKTPNKPIKHIIPGGKTLFTDDHDKSMKELTTSVYTWLRRVSNFTEVTICFTNTPEAYKTRTIKLLDFPTGPAAIWDQPGKGKTYLAQVMANRINDGKLISITAKKDGLYVAEEPAGELVPGKEDWEPYLEFIKPPKSAYAVY